MKLKSQNIKICIILLFTFFNGFSQKDSVAVILYEKESALEELIYEDEFINIAFSEDTINKAAYNKLSEAITGQRLYYLNQLIKNHPDSEYYYIALYKKAILEYDSKNIESAKRLLIEIVESDKNRWKHYTNRSLIQLAFIYKEENDCETAQKYLKQRVDNGFHFFCGVEYDTTIHQIKNIYKDCGIEFEP